MEQDTLTQSSTTRKQLEKIVRETFPGALMRVSSHKAKNSMPGTPTAKDRVLLMFVSTEPGHTFLIRMGIDGEPEKHGEDSHIEIQHHHLVGGAPDIKVGLASKMLYYGEIPDNGFDEVEKWDWDFIKKVMLYASDIGGEFEEEEKV